jgi:hypothetical protein
MYDTKQFPSAVIDCQEATPTKTKGKLTAPQLEAMKQIYELNLEYPKRWFTSKGELENVQDKTLLALLRKGYLETRQSKVNKKVRYFRYTGKQFEYSNVDSFEKYDQENANK